MKIRRAEKGDCAALKNIFINTVKTINKIDYSAEQIEFWASLGKQIRWESLLANQKVWVVENKSELAGFGTLTREGLLDFLYVHHNHQRIGVASLLLSVIEQEAILQGNERILASVSITAQPFFKNGGYYIARKDIKNFGEVVFENQIMEKQLIAN